MSFNQGTARANLRLQDGSYCYIYHSTAVVTRQPDGHLKLDSGGWMTATTKKAMNQALEDEGSSYEVKQIGGEWYVVRGDYKTPFYDGIVI